MPMKKVRKLSGVALELTDPTARFRVNRVDSVAAGMHHNLGALVEEGSGHANRAFSDDEDDDGKGCREEEEEARDAVAKELPAIRRMSSAYQGTITGMGGGTQYGGALVQMTREALPRLDNYRNLLSIASGRDKRPTLDELLSKDDLRKQSIQQDGGAGADAAGSSGSVKFGWVQGVMVRCMLNIWGVMLFLRLSWVVAQSGVGMGCVVILLSALVTTLTALSMSAISTNGQVKAGGIYFMISRALGPEFGAAVGLIYSLACAVGTAMHTVGFAESVGDLLRSLGTQIVDGGKNDIRIIGVSAVVVMLCICLIGMSWEAKAQMGLLVILVIAIVDFIIGAFVGPTSEEEIAKGFIGLNGTLLAHNFWPDYRETDGQMQSFFSIFAIFFPSATGILAGANISGDLKDPSSAIPKGTLLAIIITTISYLVFILLAGASVLRDATGNATEVTGWAFANCTGAAPCHWGLHNSFQVMELVSIFGPLIYAGCFAATLSSALASLVSAPKVFQALCSDRLYPGLHWFAKGYGRSNEAYRSYALAFIIALAFILIAELNAIAPLISNFFLASYALVNFCTFHATLAKPIGWRPTFKYYNMWLSLAGFVLCVAIMFLMSWITAVITLAGLLGLYLMVMYRSPDVNWGSSTQAQTYTSAIKSLQRLNEVREHVKNYRPQVLVLCGRPSARPPLIDLGHLLTRNVSLLVAGNVELDPLSHKARSAVVRSGNAWLRRHNIRAFVATVDGCGAGGCGSGEGGKGLDVGTRALVQATGVGKMRPNVMLVGFKADWQTCPPRSLRQYFDVLLMALDHHLGLAVLRNGDFLDYRKILDDNNESAAIEAAVRSSTPAPPTPQATPKVPRRRKVTEVEEEDEEEDKGEEGDVEEEEEEEEKEGKEEKEEEERKKKEATQPAAKTTKSPEVTGSVTRTPPEASAAKTNGAPPANGNDVGMMEGGMLKMFKKGKENEAEVYRGIGGAPLPNDVLDRLTYFRRKQGKGVIDVWWLYDDGGLTLLLPYLINTRGNWAGCRLRVFALANSKDNLEMEQISIANLLSKFRIDYSDLTMIRDITQRPLDASKAFFASLIQNFRGRKTSGPASDDPSAENIISESELTAQREKTARHLRLRELLLENSKESNLVVMTLPMPRRGAVSAPLYMAWLETLTRGMPPFLLVRGNQESVLTFYS